MNPRPEAAPFAIEIDGMQACVPCDGGDTILGALLRAGCGVPYECSAGGCGSCKFTLISGALSEDVAEPAGLKASERSRGKRLACVSRATANCRIAVRLDPQYVPAVRPRRVTATFLSSRRITHDISEFVFCSKGDAQFLPGQYAKLSLPGLAGPRNYSMCNTANAAGLWHFGIRRVPGGLASQVLFDQLTVGTEVEIDAPYSVAYLKDGPDRPVVCVAGGSGLAPMLSILRGLGARGARRHEPVLFYGARTQMDVVPAEYFADIPGFDPDRQYIPVVSEPVADIPWSGATGWLHEHLRGHLPPSHGEADFFIAGPPPMVDAVRRMLVLELRIPVERLHYDRFF